ncbi:unnamed protein product [Closterium sp. NIES-54]
MRNSTGGAKEPADSGGRGGGMGGGMDADRRQTRQQWHSPSFPPPAFTHLAAHDEVTDASAAHRQFGRAAAAQSCQRSSFPPRCVVSLILTPQSAEEVLKTLVTVRVLLIGDLDAPPNKEAVAAAVAESVKCDLLPLLVSRLPVFDWEARKEMVLVWTYLLAYGGKRRRPKGDEDEDEDDDEDEEGGEGGGAQKGAPQEEEEEEGPAVALEFVERHTELVDKLVRGYKQKEIAQNSGLMLRECLRSPKLVR